MGSRVIGRKDVNMAAGRRVHSLYDLATFTTVRNCDLFKLEYRSLPNAVQCDIYRTVCILLLSSYFFFRFVTPTVNVYKICLACNSMRFCCYSALRLREEWGIGIRTKWVRCRFKGFKSWRHKVNIKVSFCVYN